MSASAAGIAMLVDVAFAALELKIERDVILAKIRERQAAGDSLEQITDFLRGMRDGAILKAQDEINRA